MNIGFLIVALIGGALGIISTVYLTISMPVVIGWKIYRKICFGKALTD